ncbi:hypothetical protein [Candidatus Protochlamydia phocaeensis]|uniref:hypothetical protein n=1 Tax=Candidatus Protochlamydia phocaeensis TaxID=1414722 RepID=UPI000839302C|nr:hypothetical protein [Candidatus Protochlamydia phocaeensis]
MQEVFSSSHSWSIQDNMNRFIQRVQQQQRIYANVLSLYGNQTGGICSIANREILKEIVAYFGPCLKQSQAKIDLLEIFEASFHPSSQALIVANRGATLFCSSPLTGKPYITRHLACSVYHPCLGQETVNVGLVGNIYEGRIILRSESACIPSFLFGSQRCNCCYQWASIRELAAHLNPVQLPDLKGGEDFEKWTQSQFILQEGRHLPAQSGPGLILMHLDSQSGMGSGLTEQEFVYDLYNRALLRQLGENTAEQLFDCSIKEGYESLGVLADARLGNQKAGYQLTSIVLDWLQSSRDIICLSNNRHKLEQLEQHGYSVTRVKSLGMINPAGAREAKQRGTDFQHLDIDDVPISFEEELQRLKQTFASRP